MKLTATSSFRSSKQRPETDGDNYQMAQDRHLQTENRGQRRPVSLAQGSTHAKHGARPGCDGDQDRRQQETEPEHQTHLRRWICVTSRTAPLSAEVVIRA